MANFNLGDYVQITPIPEESWSLWEKGVHGLFAGRIGYIDKIIPDILMPNDRFEDIVFVVSAFEPGVFDSGPGNYFTFFKKRHLIKLSDSEIDVEQLEQLEQLEVLEEFENITKSNRDKIFKYIFSSDKEREEIKLKEKIEEIEKEELSCWEDKTEEYETL